MNLFGHDNIQGDLSSSGQNSIKPESIPINFLHLHQQTDQFSVGNSIYSLFSLVFALYGSLKNIELFGLKNEWDVVGSDKKWALEI